MKRLSLFLSSFLSRSLFLFSACALLIVVVGCSKKEAAEQMQQTSKVNLASVFPIVKKLPAESFMFAAISTSGKAYEKFKTSPWGKSSDFNASLEQVSGQLDPSSRKLVDWLLQENKKNPFDKRITGGMALISCAKDSANCDYSDAPGQIGLGIVLACKNDQNCQQLFTGFRDNFSASSGARIASQTDNELELVFTPTPTPGTEAKSSTLFVQQNGSFLLAGYSKQLLAKVANANQFPAEQFPRLKQVASEGKLLSPDSLVLGWLEVPSQAPENIKSLPLDFAHFRRDFSKELSDKLDVALKPDSGEKYLTPLSEAARFDSGPPKDALLALSVSGGSIRSLLTLVKEQQPGMTLPFPVENFGTVHIAATPGGVGSLFPNIMISVSSKDAGTIRQQIEALVSASLKGGQLPISSQWQKTKVRERDASFIVSPLGIGAFLAETSGGVALASSQSGLEQLIDLQEGKGDSLFAANQSKHLRNSNAFVYLDFHGIADAMTGLQSSLSVFTGGQPVVEPDQIAQLKELGQLDYSVSSADNTISLSGKYRAVAARSDG